MDQYYVKNASGERVAPITSLKAVRDENGNPLDSILGTVNDSIDDIKDAMSIDNWKISSYVINQTEVDGNARLPEDVIVDHLASMDNTATITVNGNTIYKDAIRRIRANSHLYIGRYNTTTEKLEARQVSDTDKTKWAVATPAFWAKTGEANVTGAYTDGVAATLPNSGTAYADIAAAEADDWVWTAASDAIVWGTEDDLFMKLPKFWWKCEEVAEDIYKISISDIEEAVDNTWNVWEGDTFIGVYEAFIGNDKVYSKSGVTPTVNQSWTTFTADARARYNNNNYRIVTYEAHQIMCLLGYGWLGTTNDQGVVGAGTSSYPKTTGLTNSKGMNDSKASVDSNSTSINFWGLENWWGDIAEWIDNIMTSGSGNVAILGDDRTTTARTVATTSSGVGEGEIRKMVLGTNGDMVPKKTAANDNYNRGYTVLGYVYSGAGRVTYRSTSAAHLYGGLGSFSTSTGAGIVAGSVGSRLLYKGSYIIVNALSES